MKKRIVLLGLIGILAVILIAVVLLVFKNKNVATDPFWLLSDETNTATIDHSKWQSILDEYLVTDDPSGINYVDYQSLLEEDSQLLVDYLEMLATVNPTAYSRAEQLAYWINLYNALTVKLIIDNYPLESITKLGKSKLSFGPWDDQITVIASKALSLNDIEHSILRPIWKDYRIHFAVNCASKGCPNLQDQAFTRENTLILFNKAATEYLQHPRGLSYDGKTLTLSSIFDWYKQDFGENQQQRLNTLLKYLPDEVSNQLRSNHYTIKYDYDWALNDIEF